MFRPTVSLFKLKLLLFVIFIIIFLLLLRNSIFAIQYPLDDIFYNKINEKKISSEKRILMYADDFLHLYVKNSSWDEFLLSKNFKNKFNDITGVIPDLDIVNMHFIHVDNYVENKCMTSFELKDNKVLYAITKLVYLDDGKTLDDILTYIIPTEKYSLTYEEMYNLAFNDN